MALDSVRWRLADLVSGGQIRRRVTALAIEAGRLTWYQRPAGPRSAGIRRSLDWSVRVLGDLPDPVEPVEPEPGPVPTPELARHIADLLDLLGLAEANDVRSGTPPDGTRWLTAYVRDAAAAIGMEPAGLGTGYPDPAIHEVIGSVDVADPRLDGRIAEHIRHGFFLGGELVRPARVTVYAYSGGPA